MCNCNKVPSSSSKANASKTNAAMVFVPPFQSRRKKKENQIAPLQATIQTGEPDIENLSGETIADKCQTFAYVLGLENPVPEKVLIAAIENKKYAQRLLMHRNDPYLYELLNNPPEALSENTTSTNPSFSGSALIAKAGKALLNWGLAGFPTVSAAILKKREDACLACPNLIEPENALQKFSAPQKITDQIGSRTGNKSCAVCGCVARNKMRLATETCPEEAPETPDLNRWGEPILHR